MSKDGRNRVARHLANHVVSTLSTSGVELAVVTNDSQVESWARDARIQLIEDPGGGLDAAAAAAANWAMNAGMPWVIVHGDLPRLKVHDVTSVCDGLKRSDAVIAPSADGGTSAIGSRRPVEFSYGPASFHRHLARLGQPEVVVRTGLLFDIDDAHDLRQAGLEPSFLRTGSRG